MVCNNNQDKQPLKLSLTAEEKGTDWRGRKRTWTEGERQEGRGQDEEKCWFEGVEGEKWVGQLLHCLRQNRAREQRGELPCLLSS